MDGFDFGVGCLWFFAARSVGGDRCGRVCGGVGLVLVLLFLAGRLVVVSLLLVGGGGGGVVFVVCFGGLV